MKKLLPVLAACVLIVSTGFTLPHFAVPAPVSMSEPEPHPNNIYVKLKVNGQATTVWVLAFPSETVGSVKESVGDILGFSIDHLTLHYQGQPLDDNATLAFYGIGSNVTLSAY